MSGNGDAFEGHAVLELMGHRRLAGFLSEQQIGGASFLRIDVPCDPPATQFYAPSAVYAITPCSEETARQVAAMSRPAPVQRWELPAAPPVVEDDEPEWGDDL
ncbi:MAG TPA: hypothetical protein VFJ19_09490 [Nocardioidaceae bacterium]|nr:hypothetical protein [Nocardioidaceae bacterium]